MPSEGERAPELLRADREQLDRAAVALGGGEPALVLLVCEKALISAALGRLRKTAGVEIPEPVVLQGSEEALGALVGTLPEIAAGKVRSLALGAAAKEALRALNWHREKLLRGAPVALWLDGVDGLTEMREAAPDAYSFRDMVVLVRGDGGRLPQASRKESRAILEIRRQLARARTALERASAYDHLSDALRNRGSLVEAETVARRGLETLPENRHIDEAARVVRAHLWASVAAAAIERGSQARGQGAALNGLKEIRGAEGESSLTVLMWLLSLMPGPNGHGDRESAARAFLLAQAHRLNSTIHLRAAWAIAEIATALGDVAGAYRVLDELDIRQLTPLNASGLSLAQGYVMRAAGRMLDAESYFQQGISAIKIEDVTPAFFATVAAVCWMERGELHIAEQLIRETYPTSDPAYSARWQELKAKLALEKGECSRALEHSHTSLRDAARLGSDRDHLDACRLLAQITIQAHGARRVDDDSLGAADRDLEVAEEVSRSLLGSALLPWYPIRLLGFRADVLIRTEAHAKALDLARRALDLARATCPDLIPECGRGLAERLLRIGKAEDALQVLAEVEPEAVLRGMLRDLARIRAARVLALVLLDQLSDAIEPVITALREVLESTGAPRIKAETLLELAIRLPPATTLPDPLALATETHALFVEMPIPAKEARSLELAGDILAARGKPVEAKRRYVLAQGILERRGLGLRLPWLKSKLKQLG